MQLVTSVKGKSKTEDHHFFNTESIDNFPVCVKCGSNNWEKNFGNMNGYAIYCNTCKSYVHDECKEKNGNIFKPQCPECKEPLYPISYYCRTCEKIVNNVSIVNNETANSSNFICSKCENPISYIPVKKVGLLEYFFLYIPLIISAGLSIAPFVFGMNFYFNPFIIIAAILFITLVSNSLVIGLFKYGGSLEKATELLMTPDEAEIWFEKSFIKRIWDYFVILFLKQLPVTISQIVLVTGLIIYRIITK